jgi:AcrR family transcriptional regulator
MTRKKPMGRSKLSLRKAPRQARSRATVDAVLEATTDILVREGAAKLTTNRIAERAGVNIASLYQYFPGKEAILAELRRRHVVEQAETVRQALQGLHGHAGGHASRRGFEAMLRGLVDIGIAAHSVAPELHRVLTDVLPPRRSRMAKTHATVTAGTGAAATKAAGHAPEDPADADVRRLLKSLLPADMANRDLALWMIDTASYAVIHRGIVERPADVASGAVADELVRLLARYLRGRGRRRAPRG